MPALHLTAQSINALKLATTGQAFYRDTKLEGFGLRVGTKRKSYFVEKRVDGRTVRHTIGVHGQITAEQARKDAAAKLGIMTAGADLNADKRARIAARNAEKGARAAAAQYTVEALCDWYIKHQTALKKQSATDAAGIFAKHVKGSPFAALPASEFTAKQATALIRTVVEKGHARTAAKLRSYLRAAFSLAQGADTNPQAPAALVLFGVETNPIASTAAIKNSTGTRDVTMTDHELGEFLRLLRERRAAQHDDALAAIELSLVLAGQRLAQVLRVTRDDVNLMAGTITLWDPKGRRETARRHVLPLTDVAVDLLKAIENVRRAEWLFGDKASPTSPDTIARKGVELLAEAQTNVADRAGQKARPKLEPRDIRRTAETLLASMGISKDVRAQVLSHGLGGVQQRSYDRHDYAKEKRHALQAWADHLQMLVDHKPGQSNVKALRNR